MADVGADQEAVGVGLETGGGVVNDIEDAAIYDAEASEVAANEG